MNLFKFIKIKTTNLNKNQSSRLRKTRGKLYISFFRFKKLKNQMNFYTRTSSNNFFRFFKEIDEALNLSYCFSEVK